jgi:hypothetical protein
MRADVRRLNPAMAFLLLALALCIGAAAFASRAEALKEENGVVYGSKIIGYSTDLSTTQAGGHPDFHVFFKVGTKLTPENPTGTSHGNSIKTALVETPQGFIGNPHATPLCPKADFVIGTCSPDSQVGFVEPGIELQESCRHKGDDCNGFVPCCGFPLYNIIPPPEQAGLLGFQAVLFGYPIFTVLSARTGGDYGLDSRVIGITQTFPLRRYDQTLWGVPASPVHFAQRFPYGGFFPGFPGIESNAPEAPFLSNPTTCTGPLQSTFTTLAYDNEPTSKSLAWPATTGCDSIGFKPSLSASPSTTEADSASGVDIDLQVPQTPSPVSPSDSEIKALSVTFPEGFSINPNAADGKVSCADAAARFGSEAEAECPQFSKVGSLSLLSSALPEALPGSIYLGVPLPGNRYRLFITANGFGTHIKLAGTVRPNPQTGRLTVAFEDLPQSPLSRFQMHFFGSERGLLATPTGCGKYPVETNFTPWDNVLPDQQSTQFFEITSGPGGSPCPGEKRPFSPGFRAAGQVNGAGLHGPFSVQVSRPDGDQNLERINAKAPPGFLATLKGIPYCPDSAIAKAASEGYAGLAEQAFPSCPAASQVGVASSGSGAGTHPLYSPGKVYLAGPYKGAPLSFAIITPAVSGPYDLGNVVVRAAVRVDPESAQVTVVSDPLPRILEGVPLRLRSIQIDLDRENFTLNPTSCEPFSVQGTIFGSEGGVANPADHFQVGNCGSLGYAPKLSLRLSGGLARLGHPAIHAVLTTAPGEANSSSVSVALPPGELLDNAHINNICTKVQFTAGGCPAGSELGTARVKTPLLSQPLSGKAYLRANPSGGLPNLVVDLHGQIDVVLVGKIDTAGKGSLRTTFPAIPDAPVEEFTLDLAGGKKGLVQNSKPICGSRLRATVKMVGHNGAHHNAKPLLQSACGKARAKRHKQARRGSGR